MSNLHGISNNSAAKSPRPLFESLDHRVTTPADIDDLVGHALYFQNFFTKKTTPWEKQNWDDDKLDAFRIVVDQLDRVYHIEYIEGQCDIPTTEYQMLARQKTDDGYIYVELMGKCEYSGFNNPEDVHVAYINISEDANYFVRNLWNNNIYPVVRIQQSLAEDGNVIKPRCEPLNSRNPVTLPSFKSQDPRLVGGVATIYTLLGYALRWQQIFEKRIIGAEKSQWDDERLEAFRVTPERFDRVYHMQCFEDDEYPRRDYCLVARQQRSDGGYIYLELNGKCANAGFGSSQHTDDAVIYITENVNLFVIHLAKKNQYLTNLVQQSLEEEEKKLKEQQHLEKTQHLEHEPQLLERKR